LNVIGRQAGTLKTAEGQKFTGWPSAPFSPQKTAPGRKWLVSNEGGRSPVWSRNGRELFYGGLDSRVHVAEYAVKGDSFVAEKPRFWSERKVADSGSFFGFDVAPDGKRVLALFPAEDAKPETILHVLLNVDGELRRRAPATPHK
jgi:serine/threonine-protein kinase